LAIGRAPIGRCDGSEPRRFLAVRESDGFGEDADIVVGDRQLVVGVAVVKLHATLAVGQKAWPRRPALAIDCRGNAEAQQHPLCGFKAREVALRQADARALLLRSEHGPVGIEEAAQEAAIEVARLLLDLWR